jgi:uncharacterized protein YgiM (DUF1202 family)
MMVETTANLNLRSGAGTGFPSIGILPNATRGAITGAPVVNGAYTWYPVQMNGFPAGWVAGSFLRSLNITATPAGGGASPTATRTPTRTPTVPGASSTATLLPGGFAPGTEVRATANLRLRTAPSLSSGTIAIMPSGATGVVTGTPVLASGYTFYPVNMTLYGQGWAAGEFLEETGAAQEPTPTRTLTTVPGAFPVGSTVEARLNVNVRTGPGATNGIMGVMSAGQQGTVVEGPVASGGYLWHRLSIPGIGTGWVAGAYLIPASGASAESAAEVDAAVQQTEPEPTSTPAVESIPTNAGAPEPTPTATIDPGPRPWPIVRMQRTDGSTEGQVLVDEDPSTIWTSPGLPDQQVGVFVADLGEARDISTVRWLPAETGIAGQLVLSISSDGQAWTDLDLVTAVTDGVWSEIVVGGSARFVRFAFVAIDETPVLGGIAEVEIWP